MSEERPEDRAMRREDEPEKADVGAMHAPIMREKLDPKDGYEPIPLWLVTVFGALLFWGGWYLATYSGGFRRDVLDEQPAARFSKGDRVPEAPVDLMAVGKRLYTANCLACHQGQGQGIPGAYPPLAGSEWVLGDPDRLKRIVLGGLEGPVTVKGQTYNGSMPAFMKLSDEQISRILGYIRNAWGNEASVISPASVEATRQATRERSAPWTASELVGLTTDDFPDEAAGQAAVAPTTGPATGPAR